MKHAMKYAIVAIFAATVSASATELPLSMRSAEDLSAFAQSLERDVATASERQAVTNIQLERAKAEVEQLKEQLAKAQSAKTPTPAPAPSPMPTPAPTPAPAPAPAAEAAPQ